MLTNLDTSKFPLRIEGECKDKKFLPLAVRVWDKMSTIPTMEIEFYCENEKLALTEIVGKTMHLVAEDKAHGVSRWFRGTCISAEFVRQLDVGGHFCATVRPWFWFLTRNRDVRIFQDTDAVAILNEILSDNGFSGRLEDNLTGVPSARKYCVQYRESDFAFISRLLEEEGIYYYFKHDGGVEKLVLADDSGYHDEISHYSQMDYLPYGAWTYGALLSPYILRWSWRESIRSGKVSLEDYNFETPKADLSVESVGQAGSYSSADFEQYDHPGHYRESSDGEDRAKVRMEAEAVPHNILTGRSNGPFLAVGGKVSVAKPPRDSDPKEILITETYHEFYQLEALKEGFFKNQATTDSGNALSLTQKSKLQDKVETPTMVDFKGIPAGMQFRAPLTTPWPKVSGIHTAMVVGPEGEEIHTDKYGRIKVQFHWDRDGENNELSSCWVRTMMPWTGKNWGAIAVPRIGQEVVIDFEEGDPDRPLCVGMLYNAETMPPYKLPDNKTQSGVKTNSSKGGGGFNELMFEDKKDKELVRFQAEKDYKQIVKNDAEITVGLEKKDKGDLSVTVHNDVTETINEGNYTELVKKGDHKTRIKKGDHETVLDIGDMKVDVKKGKITVSAKKSIEFKVGGTTLKMDPMSVNIKSKQIAIKGGMQAELSSPKTTVKGNAMLTLKGGFVFIN